MLIHGDSLDYMRTMDDNSVDAIVTDPPYGLAFMGKKWDYDVPSVELWSEALRVLKPGGHLLSFGGTRTYHRMVVNIEDAGFEIRDQIMWLYGSGFPKSLNISKAIDNTAITPEAKQWDGWGTALKPANEPICVARKPLSESTVAKNVLKWGTGGINVDATRIGEGSAKRFPANLILDEQAALLLDEQSGVLKSGALKPYVRESDDYYSGSWPDSNFESKATSGGASRFFYCAKASKSERNAGSKEHFNIHPTCKPIKLMRYLVRLVTPPNGTVLDPFCGSGTTGVAAKQEGFNFIGIEREAEYVEIARRRFDNV